MTAGLLSISIPVRTEIFSQLIEKYFSQQFGTKNMKVIHSLVFKVYLSSLPGRIERLFNLRCMEIRGKKPSLHSWDSFE